MGELEKQDAAQFPLIAGTRSGAKWQNGQACLFVNGAATGTCLAISFDTGNGVPWIRDSDSASIPHNVNGRISVARIAGADSP